jgi:hypothetical protein
LYAGYSFVFAKPHYKESFEATLISPASGTVDLVPYGFNYAPTPRVWLGYENADALGARATYWQFDQNARPLAVSPPLGSVAQVQSLVVIIPATISTTAPGDVLEVANRLELHTLDVEGTARLPLASVCILGSGGLRYARLTQSTMSAVEDAGRSVTQQLNWSRFFEGVGPTGAAELRRPLGSTGIDLVGNVRGAFMFGNKNFTRSVSPGSPTNPSSTSLYHASDIVGMGMIELGAEYNCRFNCGRSLFVRGMYEGQLWTDTGSPTLTFLGFEGFSVGVGLTY